MKTNNFYRRLFISFLCVFFVLDISAQTGSFDEFVKNEEKKILSGINSLSIVIEDIRDDVKKEGLTKEQIKTDVEIRLRKAGLKIAENVVPYLYINVNTIKIDQNSFAYSITVSLRQSVVLERDKTASLIANTWERGAIGIVGILRIRTIKDGVSDFVDEFINEYLKANSSNTSQNSSNNNNQLPNLDKYDLNKKQDSPFTATYIGENRPPEVEIFNDSDRTLYLDFGQDALTPYTILPKTSKKLTLTEGIYKYKANAPRVVPLAGDVTFQKGYRYTWRFVIVTRKIN